MWYNVWPWTQYDPAFNTVLGARNEDSIPGLSRFPGEVSLRSAPYNPAWHDLSVLHSGTMMLHWPSWDTPRNHCTSILFCVMNVQP